MTQTITTTNDGQAFIAVKRNRVKQDNNKVYLQNKQEFEIELFNPTQNTKLAKISINGKQISTSGIVIKPGQRVYLERFLDVDKKFLFETYKVEGSALEVMKAIAQNGLIQVDFYDEKSNPITLNSLSFTPWSGHYPSDFSWTTSCYSSNSSPVCDRMDGSEQFGNLRSTSESANLKQQYLNSKYDQFQKSILRSAEKETGRVEAGNKSDQKFTTYNGDFNSWISNSVILQLLPASEKPLESSDLAVYCTQCGTKNKGGKYKFCPKCGNKFGE